MLKGLLVLLGVLWSGQGVADGEPQLIASGEFKPYTSSEYPQGGFLHELVMLAMQSAGIPAKEYFLPWGRGYSGVQKHHFFATFPYVWTRERSNIFLYSKPLVTMNGGIFVRREDKAKYQNFEDVSRGKLCFPKYYSLDFLSTYPKGQKLDIQRASDELGCLRMLALGRVDAFPSEVLVSLELTKIHEDLKGKFALLDWSVDQKTYHLLIHKSYPDGEALLEKFDASYQQLIASDVWANTLKKHRINPRWAQQAGEVIIPAEYPGE